MTDYDPAARHPAPTGPADGPPPWSPPLPGRPDARAGGPAAPRNRSRPVAAEGPREFVQRPVSQRIWCENRKGFQALSVWTEQVAGHGEDAEPFVAHHLIGTQGLLAVFDGSGGAGAAPVWQASDGTRRTGAWVGARVARLATDCWFRDVATRDAEVTPETLHEYLEYFLSMAPQRRSKIGGTMRRQLPTTLAAVHYNVLSARDEQRLELHSLWAGDSRAYVLRPETGLHVLTRDHTRESDALELLRSDPPMTNLVCADREFVVDSHRLEYPLPCVLLAASDGFFGYVHTPADFELLLLRTLYEAGTVGEWADRIRREVLDCTADDASLALVALGYHDFESLRTQFAARFTHMNDRYVRTRPHGLDRLSPAPGTGTASAAQDTADLPARVREWQETTWHAYRAGYETHLPPAPEERI